MPGREKVDPKRIVELIKQGNTAAQISRRTGVSRGVIWRVMRDAAAKPKG